MKKTLRILCIVLALALTVTLIQLPQERVLAKSDLPEEAQKRVNNAVILYIGSADAYVNNQKRQVDSLNSDVTPISLNGRSLVPVRFVSESLGAKVEWTQKTSTATVKLNGKTIKLVIDSNKMLLNNKEVTLEVPAKRINNRVFVPFRAITEALGKKVFYDRGLIVISSKDNIFNVKTEKTLIDGVITKVNNLPVVGSEAKLKELLKNSKSSYGYYKGFSDDTIDSAQGRITNSVAEGIQTDAISPSSSLGNSAPQSMKSMNNSKSVDYSTTNVQVQGVDEADVVKTDGKYIYQVNNQRVVVAEVYPAEEMKVVSMLNFDDQKFSPQELYVDSKQLIAIGSTYMDVPVHRIQDNPNVSSKHIMMPPAYSRNTVKAIIFDISDKNNIKQVREIELEGNYVSSRKIGSALYLISNKYVNFYYIENGTENFTPSFHDSACKTEVQNIDYSQIRYFPGCESSNYMVIAGINLDNKDEKANVFTYLGSGSNIFASQENLYVAVTKYNDYRDNTIKSYNNTQVYKFSLDNGKVTYLCKGEAPGTILNQFSMDEYNGNFRIATTTTPTWRSSQNTTQNNIYILSDTLSQVGKIEDIAPGERIYSTRFMGNKGYMVTFRQVDPLFVIDLTPESPKILGALKIPGYSDYLHPYDENHIIGFGKDTEESKDGNSTLIQGMKIAIFDVSDVNNPKEKYKEVIGERGTDSELLRNHKALLFSKEKNLLAFPITVVQRKASNLGELITGDKSYQTFFQGAYIYNIDLKTGFTLKAKITHISDEDYKKSGYYSYESNKNVERILYIDNVLYTLSKAIYKAHSLNDMRELNKLEIK